LLETATAEAVEALADALERASEREGRTLASATVELDPVDACAVAMASRLASDRWFCWERAEGEGFALAALGSAHEVVSRGADRFADVARDCSELIHDAELSAPDGMPAGAGPVWTGGFAFAADGGASAHWASLPPAMMVMPQVSLLREGARCHLTLNAVIGEGDSAEDALRSAKRRVASLSERPPGLIDPEPTSSAEISAPLPPSHYEQAVAAAVEAIRAGALEKTVLAREIAVSAGQAHDPAAVFGALRELFPSCFCFCVGTPEASFIGASPELLIRRRGAVAATLALAGSTRRSADPAVDDHLGEQMMRSDKVRSEHDIVAKRIERTLRPHSVWGEAADEPVLARVANIQHLATPIRAQLADARSAIELAGALHPTPAVGGEPREEGLALIDRLEELDRGWYAGPVGWMDAAEDGEFCVALRSALLRDREARLYAGCGIVAGSEAESELAETEIKFDALLPLLL
jgi:salicylate biosynthesis isochorismate synthase/menaquinone-specific isochorismate synthase